MPAAASPFPFLRGKSVIGLALFSCLRVDFIKLPGLAKFPTLYFIRHGETAWNAEGRLQGQQDIPMNARGEKQALRCGALLKDILPARTLPFIASPMLRTLATMLRIRHVLAMPEDGFLCDARLKEISFGRWEGLTWPQVEASDPKGAARRAVDKWGFAPPDGESYEMLMHRIAGWLETISEPSVVVAHGGVARVLLVLAGGQPSVLAPNIDIWQGRVLLIERDSFSWIG
jgi:broad specificity phosphatase PhoE